MHASRRPPIGGAAVVAGLTLILVIGGAWLRRLGGAEETVEADGGAGAFVTEDAARAGADGGAGADPGDGLAIPVTAAHVRRGTLVLEIVGTGEARAHRRAEIAAAAAGWVAAVAAREGQLVSRGQVLLRLDARDAALEVERTRADRAEAESRYRELTLMDEPSAAGAEDSERDRAVRIRSGLARADVALRQAELALARTTVTAPFAGRVADVRVAAGEYVSPGSPTLALVELDPARIEVLVVESEVRWLREGAAADVSLVAFPDTTFRGRVVSISPVVDSTTRSARVTVSVPNPDGAILPGMYARVAIAGRSFADRLLVPREAVVERDGRKLVFVFRPLPEGPSDEGLAEWTYVETGLSDGRHVELVQGEGAVTPAAGSRVLTGGHVTLAHGARVRLDATASHEDP